MTPEPEKPASVTESAAGAEVIAAAAVTLEGVQDAIYEEGELSKDRQQELLREVMECRKKLETLSDSVGLAVKTENPAIQQLLMEVGRIQTEIQSMRTDLNILLESDESSDERESGEVDRQEKSSPRSNSPYSKREENDITPSGPQSETAESQPPPESNQSATPAPPKKKRYIRI